MIVKLHYCFSFFLICLISSNRHFSVYAEDASALISNETPVSQTEQSIAAEVIQNVIDRNDDNAASLTSSSSSSSLSSSSSSSSLSSSSSSSLLDNQFHNDAEKSADSAAKNNHAEDIFGASLIPSSVSLNPSTASIIPFANSGFIPPVLPMVFLPFSKLFQSIPGLQSLTQIPIQGFSGLSGIVTKNPFSLIPENIFNLNGLNPLNSVLSFIDSNEPESSVTGSVNKRMLRDSSPVSVLQSDSDVASVKFPRFPHLRNLQGGFVSGYGDFDHHHHDYHDAHHHHYDPYHYDDHHHHYEPYHYDDRHHHRGGYNNWYGDYDRYRNYNNYGFSYSPYGGAFNGVVGLLDQIV